MPLIIDIALGLDKEGRSNWEFASSLVCYTFVLLRIGINDFVSVYFPPEPAELFSKNYHQNNIKLHNVRSHRATESRVRERT